MNKHILSSFQCRLSQQETGNRALQIASILHVLTEAHPSLSMQISKKEKGMLKILWAN